MLTITTVMYVAVSTITSVMYVAVSTSDVTIAVSKITSVMSIAVSTITSFMSTAVFYNRCLSTTVSTITIAINVIINDKFMDSSGGLQTCACYRCRYYKLADAKHC